MATSTCSPLTGIRVLVTRAREQAGALTDLLEQLGAAVVELPVIEIVAADPRPIDAAIRELATYDWIMFTSANGVTAFVDRLQALNMDSSATASLQIGAIGRATAERLRECGIQVDLVPEQFIAESVIAEMAALGVDGKRVLIPQAEIARDVVANGLRQAGAEVDVVVAYRTTLPDGIDAGEVQRLCSAADIVTFASSSAVRNAVALAGRSLTGKRVVCIGPVTADTAREAGLTVAVVAGEYSIPGLVEAVVRLVEGDTKGVPDGNEL